MKRLKRKPRGKLQENKLHIDGQEMGETHITVQIRNPAQPERTWEGLFLVDTGAIDTVVPRPILESIGLQAEGQRVYTLADGSEVTMDIAVSRLEFMGEITGGAIMIADAGAEPLLGIIAMQGAGIVVDTRNETVSKLPSIGLRKLDLSSP